MILDEPFEVVNKVPMTTYIGIKGAKCHLVHTKNEWDAFFDLLMKRKKVAFDTETTGFEYFKDDKIIGFSFGWGLENFYIASRHVDSALEGEQIPQIPFEYMVDDLQEYFNQTNVTTIYFNAKFDQHFLGTEGIVDRTITRDASIFWAFYDENSPGKLKTISSGWKDIMGMWHKGVVHKDAAADEKLISTWRTAEARYRRKLFTADVAELAGEYKKLVENQDKKLVELKKLAKQHLIEDDHPYAKVSKKDIHYGFIPIKMMAKYAGLDTYLTWEVFFHCVNNIKWNKPLADLVRREHRLSAAIFDIEETGVLIDRPGLIESGVKLDKEIKALHHKVIHDLHIANPNSSPQIVASLLSMGATLTEHTDAAKGCVECASNTCAKHFKADSAVLESLVEDYPKIQYLLDYRAKSKIKNTYVDSIVARLTKDDILHCNFRLNVSTGRMASSDPNLQNIPRRDTTIRAAFMCPEDYIFVFADYSQIEVRMTAHYSEDPALLKAYSDKRDLHLSTMCAMFRYDYDTVAEIYFKGDHSDPMYNKIKELRSVAKILNFACVPMDTEALTLEGWKHYEDITTDDKVLGSVDGNLQWVPVLDKVYYPTAPLVKMHNKHFSAVTTPNHRWKAQEYKERKGHKGYEDAGYITTHDIRAKHKIVLSEPLLSEDSSGLSVTDAAVFGWLITDGHISRSEFVGAPSQGKNGEKVRFEGSIFQLKEEFIEELKVLLKDVDHSLYVRPSGTHQFYIKPDYLRALWRRGRIDELGYEGVVRLMGTEQLAAFNKAVYQAEGTLGTPILTQNVGAVQDAIVLGAFLEGNFVTKQSKGTYKKYECHDIRKCKPGVTGQKLKKDTLSSAPVWCLTTPADSWVMRQSGGIMLTGNCIYGVSARGLSAQIPRPTSMLAYSAQRWIDECQAFMDSYMYGYLGVKKLINRCGREVKKTGKLTNSFGRVRHLPHANACRITHDKELRWMERRAQRQSTNALIQGECADLFKEAVVRTHDLLKPTKSKVVNLVHDEIQMYIHKSEIHLLSGVKKAMEDFQYRVEIIADFEYSTTNWADKTEVA